MYVRVVIQLLNDNLYVGLGSY